MKHLSDAELVDAAAGALPPVRGAHLDSCGPCRTAVADVAATMRDIAAVAVPEPSPLFWEHFSGRVHDALASEEPSGAGLGLLPTWARLVALCVVVLAVVSLVWVARSRQSNGSVLTTASNGVAQPVHSTTPALDATEGSDDAAWAVLNAAASDLSPDATPGTDFNVRPAAVDTAVQRLTPQERTELGRLLESEMKHSSN